MNSLEEKTHSFIVRIWIEPREIEGAPPHWRGEIKHVPSGKQIYLRNLAEITSFVADYLEEMGIKFVGCQKLRKWLSKKVADFC
jgi:hypothetical protein